MTAMNQNNINKRAKGNSGAPQTPSRQLDTPKGKPQQPKPQAAKVTPAASPAAPQQANKGKPQQAKVAQASPAATVAPAAEEAKASLSRNQIKKLRKQQQQQKSEAAGTEKPAIQTAQQKKQSLAAAAEPKGKKPSPSASPFAKQQQQKPAQNQNATAAKNGKKPEAKAVQSKKSQQIQEKEASNDDDEDDEDDDEESSGVLEVPEEVQTIEKALSQLEEEHDKEAAKLVSQFDTRRAPLYAKRREALKKIEGFWYSALGSHEGLCDFIEEADVDILEHLNDVYVERNETGYRLTFGFAAENPYHTSTSVTAEVRTIRAMQEKDLDELMREDLVDRVIRCDEIAWKPNMKPKKSTATVPSEDGSAAGNKRARQYEGFFSHFGASADPVGAAVVFNIIANDLFPDAVNYYQYCADSDDEDDMDDCSDDDDCQYKKSSGGADDDDEDESSADEEAGHDDEDDENEDME